ncbi:MAG: hypothetical protein U9N84_02640 [Actinomycetota bacterium]|nr:hypothetical protein [Actinomycetota bacterium]
MTGLYLDMRPMPVESYPFAIEPIAAGSSIGDSLSWRDVPRGLLPSWEGPVAGLAGSQIAIGDPVLPSAITEHAVPADWWAVPVPLPMATAPGTPLRLLLNDVFATGTVAEGTIVDGIVVAAGIDTGFETIGMVAFAPVDAPRVANAAAHDALIVMIGFGSSDIPPTG